MKLKPNIKNLHNIMFYVLMVAVVVFFIALSLMPAENKNFNSEDCYSLKDSCVEVTANGERKPITLPSKLDTQEDMSVTVEYTIPQTLDKIYALCLRTSQQSLEVKYDGKVIYTFGMDKGKIPIGKSPGSAYNMIRLPMDSAGKTVSFKITAFDNFYKGHVNEIYAGTKASVLFFLIKDNLVNLLVASVIFIIGLALLIAGVVFRKVLRDDRQMRYIGWFSVIMGIWLFSESKTVQFFIGNQSIIYFLAIISLLILAIPILQYVLTIEGYHYRKIIKCAIWFLYLETTVVVTLQLLNIFQFYEMLLWIQLVRVAVVCIVVVTFAFELFKHKNRKMLAISGALLALGIGVVLEFVKFSVARASTVGEFLTIGTFAFVIVLAISAVKRSIYISELSREARYYQKMAKTDIMTRTKNRTAYIEDFEALSKTEQWKKCAVVITDVNDLKEINDYYGHHSGDDAIIRCASCLTDVFGTIGQCYRIGGDEFACIIPDHYKYNLEQYISGFERKCLLLGEECSYSFEVAAGYGFYEETRDMEFEDIPKKADKNMYKRKQALKIRKGTVTM